DLETLGYDPEKTGFRGCSKNSKHKFFGNSSWQKVSAVYRHKTDKIYKIHFRGGTVKTTGDHSIFIRSGNTIISKKASELKEGDLLVNLPFKVRGKFIPGIGTTHKIKAHQFEQKTGLKELKITENQDLEYRYAHAMQMEGLHSQKALSQMLGVSQMTVSNWQTGKHTPQALSIKNNTKIPEKVAITTELMQLFGLYTAEGSANGRLEFTLGTHEKELIEECSALMYKVFNLYPTARETEDNSTRLTYYSAPLGRFFEKHCGNGSHNKHIPHFMWEMPKEYFLSYLKGYTDGDGYTTKEGKLSASSVSKQLILELCWLLSMHGIQSGIREGETQEGRIIKDKPLPSSKYWNLIIGKTSHPFIESDSPPCQFKKPKITKIEIEEHDGYVYDLCGCQNEAFFGGEKPLLLHNSRVRDLFKKAKRNAPGIIFIDEIDAVGRHRGAGMGGGHDEREQTLNQILTEMDGFEQDTNVIVMAASVTGDTPVLIKKNGKHSLKPIKEIIDPYYKQSEEGVEKHTPNLQVLGLQPKGKYDGKKNKCTFFGKSKFQTVRSVFRHKVNEIHEIKFKGNTIRTTGNHSVFVRTQQGLKAKRVDELKPGEFLVDIPYIANRTQPKNREVRAHNFLERYNKKLPVYNEHYQEKEKYYYTLKYRGILSQAKIAEKIGVSQKTVSKWQTTSRMPRTISCAYFKHVLPEEIQITPRLCRLMGYYAAEGYARKEIDFCFNTKETEYIEDVQDLMKEIFGLKADKVRTRGSATNIIYYSKPLADFFSKHCGEGAHNKHIPSFLFETPKEYFIEFFRGYSNGDGHQDKRGRLEVTSVSKQLITELNWLSRMHGHKSFIHKFTAKAGRRVNNGKPLAETIAWRLGFGKTQNPINPSPGKANIERTKILSITKRPFNDYVYDFCGCANEAFFGGLTPILLHNTNRPDVLDPALLRPGRFDRRVVIDSPDIGDREAILKIHTANKPLTKTSDLNKIARQTPGFSGADLENLANEAAILAAKNDKKTVSQKDLEQSIEKVLMGPERKSRVLNKNERKITAYHETGHAIVGHFLPECDPVHKISIISRGMALGVTWFLPEEDKHLYSSTKFHHELASLLGGYAAEKLTFGDVSTGPSNDLERATKMARKMVTKYGMSELGPTIFGDNNDEVFLGKDFGHVRNYSEEVAAKIDATVDKIVKKAYSTALELIKKHEKKLHEISEELIKKETLTREEFLELVGNSGPKK
ncbi:AAA family ATPase, partial [Patescibacteria group bacterium]|nr:AAA family ATPase [Patescibacteria group bacterium]